MLDLPPFLQTDLHAFVYAVTSTFSFYPHNWRMLHSLQNTAAVSLPFLYDGIILVHPNSSLVLSSLLTVSFQGRGTVSDSALIWRRGRYVADTQ